MDALKPISRTLWDADKTAFAESLGSSFREIGFAVIADHGLDQHLIDDALSATKAFFDLPLETKTKYHDPNGGGQRGYVPFRSGKRQGRNGNRPKRILAHWPPPSRWSSASRSNETNAECF